MVNPKTKVILFQVNSPQEKIKKIVEVASKHASEKHPLVIMTPSKKAADYIDNLLWSAPKMSFLPHKIVKENLVKHIEYVYISYEEDTICGSRAIFNLRDTPPSSMDSFTTIYDFEDYTSEDKKKLFEKRYKNYLDAKLHLISL
ncbi:hypothetical protein COB11_05455 [Candidatus Aerophobetes bacterium]|uniref:DNA polymerase III subunit chi n=1 Tax=Aerophobetes bacterium TaxID=2030807 RepID=A0A2A4YEP0_UNCAE|nr:MAG: hypothetical protein COB11_05455 [Candidatus Aerophobetes bacterium]